jgi:hypothetical protein
VKDEHEDERGKDDNFPFLERILLRAGAGCRSVTRREDDSSAVERFREVGVAVKCRLGRGQGRREMRGSGCERERIEQCPAPGLRVVRSFDGSRRVNKVGRKVHSVYLDGELSVVRVAISVLRASPRMRMGSHADEQAARKLAPASGGIRPVPSSAGVERSDSPRGYRRPWQRGLTSGEKSLHESLTRVEEVSKKRGVNMVQVSLLRYE